MVTSYTAFGRFYSLLISPFFITTRACFWRQFAPFKEKMELAKVQRENMERFLKTATLAVYRFRYCEIIFFLEEL
jgi:hypothetical protein